MDKIEDYTINTHNGDEIYRTDNLIALARKLVEYQEHNLEHTFSVRVEYASGAVREIS